jgi:hypothetical protein
MDAGRVLNSDVDKIATVPNDLQRAEKKLMVSGVA